MLFRSQFLSASGNTEETKKYAEQIGGILKPLIPTRYTGNAILDILLSDKVRQVENRGIGLLNVRKSIDKYDGDLKLRESKGKFIAEFFLNT